MDEWMWNIFFIFNGGPLSVCPATYPPLALAAAWSAEDPPAPLCVAAFPSQLRWEDEFRGFPRLQARQMKRRDRWWEPHLSLGTTAEVWDSGRPVISVCRWEEPCPHHKMLWCRITVRNAFCPLAASCCRTDVELWLGLWIKAPNWSVWENDSLLFYFILLNWSLIGSLDCDIDWLVMLQPARLENCCQLRLNCPKSEAHSFTRFIFENSS